MSDTSIIALLVTAVTGLVGAIVYLYKRGERREREFRALIEDLLQKNNALAERLEAVLIRVEKLLTNWRGH